MDVLEAQPIRGPLPIRYLASSSRKSFDNEWMKADEELLFVHALIDSGAHGLQELLEVQGKGWNDEAMDQHFVKQRQVADNASTKLNMIWFTRMKNVLREIDLARQVVPMNHSDVVTFLDLGCSPGGFSSYILDANVSALGLGISLPPDEGGHEFALETRLQERYELHECNLTYLQLGPSPIVADTRLQEIPTSVHERHFDLVLLDGHQLRGQVGALRWDCDRLIISQLIIALRSVKEGGTILLKLPLPHKLLSARILIMLKVVSVEVSAWKPYSMHANRGTFYAVAKGLGDDILETHEEKGRVRAKIDFFLQHLQELWVELTFRGDEGTGRFINDTEDMNFVATMEEIIAHHLDWLIKLGTPLWKVQERALSKLYSKNCQRYH